MNIDPDYAGAYNNRGNTNRDIGKYEASITDFNKVIELKPDDAGAYNSARVSKRQYVSPRKDKCGFWQP